MRLMTRARAGYAVTLAAGLAIGCLTVGTASAVPARPAVQPASVVTHYYALASTAFAPDSVESPTADYYNSWNPASLRNSSADRCFNAGVSLPASATIKSVTYYYTLGNDSIYAELNRQNLISHTFKQLARLKIPGVSTTPAYTHTTKTVARTNGAVNYRKYAYSLGVCPLGTSTFSGVIIKYTTG